MKFNLTILPAACLLILMTGCKKDKLAVPETEKASSPLSLASNIAGPYMVTTIAGGPYSGSPTLVDGSGKNVRFLYTDGIQLADDGNIYVADGNRGVIRKLSPAGAVTSIKLPDAPGGEQMYGAFSVGVAKDGTINVITAINDNSDFPETWIFKPGQPAFVSTSTYATNRNLFKDPYEDFFWFNNGFSAFKYQKNPYGSVGTDEVDFNTDELSTPSNPHGSFSAFCIGYNKVKYFSDGPFIYQYTPGGRSERLFMDLGLDRFSMITGLAITKNARTFYVADSGYIRRIDDGKVTTIAGPDQSGDNKDGQGRRADVHALSIALSKDEGTLYFSDYQARAIRKIALR
ncbi:hypothetical protein AAFN85_13695 [Mucilaginibacter sp. CAU 1740]|uniref:hypothetical protein n=1 Tax=Mucilaginibacter sp. CAU 1740 TaxID=3140365 RepID=UPI00325B78C5